MIQEKLAQLYRDGGTAGEHRALSVLMNQPREVVFMTAAEVGLRAGVHESTVIRLAQKLGFRGYSELRARLRDEYDVLPILARARDREAKSHELAGYFADEASALTAMASSIPQEDLDAAAGCLRNARVVYLFGLDTLTTTLARRLRRLGILVVELMGGPRSHAERLVTFTKEDVLVAFVMSDASSYLQGVLGHVQTVGGRSIVVTDAYLPPLPIPPTYTFELIRGADAGYHTLTVPTALSYAFELAVFHLDPTAGADALGKFDALAIQLGSAASSTMDADRLTSRVHGDDE